MKEMRFESLVVRIEYRMIGIAGQPPQDKVLRARVRSSDSDGDIWGAEILTRQRVYEISRAQNICIRALSKYTDRVVFEYDYRMNRESETIEIGGQRVA